MEYRGRIAACIWYHVAATAAACMHAALYFYAEKPFEWRLAVAGSQSLTGLHCEHTFADEIPLRISCQLFTNDGQHTERYQTAAAD